MHAECESAQLFPGLFGLLADTNYTLYQDADFSSRESIDHEI
jgi:hypothetical protein